MNTAQFKDLNILPFDTSHSEGRYLVQYQNRYHEINAALAELLVIVKDKESLFDAAAVFSATTGRTYTEADIESILNKYITPILKDGKEKSRLKPRNFLFSMGLLPAHFVRTVASCFAFVYRPVFLWLFLTVSIVCEISFFCGNLGTIQTLDNANGWVVASVLGLIVLNSLFHELGHASACCSFGQEPGMIGFGLYLTFPVFYTDVTNIWRLTRGQRIMVDCGGVYFQLIFLIPFFLWYFLTENEICKLYIYATNINFLLTLNPFLRFDGYWIMSDVAGVPNLRKRVSEYVKYFIGNFWGRQGGSKPYIMEIRLGERLVMIVYTVAVNVFFLYFFVYKLPQIFWSYIKHLPSNLKGLVYQIASGDMPEISVIISVMIQLFFIGFIVLLIYRAASMFLTRKKPM